jgi:hypothetical protein
MKRLHPRQPRHQALKPPTPIEVEVNPVRVAPRHRSKGRRGRVPRCKIQGRQGGAKCRRNPSRQRAGGHGCTTSRSQAQQGDRSEAEDTTGLVEADAAGDEGKMIHLVKTDAAPRRGRRGKAEGRRVVMAPFSGIDLPPHRSAFPDPRKCLARLSLQTCDPRVCAGRYSEPNDVRSLSDTFNIHRTLPIDNNSAR